MKSRGGISDYVRYNVLRLYICEITKISLLQMRNLTNKSETYKSRAPRELIGSKHYSGELRAGSSLASRPDFCQIETQNH